MKCREVLAVASEYAPLSLSEAMVKTGMYDNSGLIIENDEQIKKILIALDLTTACVNYAIRGGYNLIITHHPAIYSPVTSLELTKNRPLTLAATNGIAVISMHLNLDIARRGIDYCFADGLGGKQQKILTLFQGENGYGRSFAIEKNTLESYAEKVKKVFSTDNVMIFGGRQREIKKVVSFCGAGCDIPEVRLAEKENADLVLATDPDSDRIGTMVRGADGEYSVITGNQLGCLLLDYVINARRATGTMPENPGAMASIVSTSMARTICEKNGVHFEDTFTGFKFMAELVNHWDAAGTYRYIFAFEESYGYMMGNYVRDKDAVTASMMVAEMAAHYHKLGMTLLDALKALYEKYGCYKEKTLNLVMPGVDGVEKMKNLMAQLRSNPPEEISGVEVVRMRDYSDGSIYVAGLGKVGTTPFSGSNVLYFELADGCTFIIRPSGTEPKIKIYLLVKGSDMAQCEERIEKYFDYANALGK